MVRKDWQNLNGLWQYSLPKSNEPPPFGKALPGRILVPFPIESSLSGVGKHADRIAYRRTFTVQAGWKGQRILLHFGAVDWEARVYVNGKSVGSHRGGYDPFTFDVTSALTKDGPQELVVLVYDPTDAGSQPRGKQVLKPGGIFYTPTTGIWQTVWMEPVPHFHMESLTLTPDVGAGIVRVKAIFNFRARWGVKPTLEVTVLNGKKIVAKKSGDIEEELRVPVPHVRLWSPDHPVLYSLKVAVRVPRGSLDTVTSYFGMRKIALGKVGGVTRLLLNGKPVFQVGVLDQGFWPDGIYTAPTDAALRYDIETVKKLGMNVIRKHVKVEPQRWYYWADKLGVLVWQDMPAGDNKTAESKRDYQTELGRMIENLRDHPSIVMWVVFNEGWGQFDTERLTAWVKAQDPSRLVDNASGWTDMKVGDVIDMHNYPGPGSPTPEPNRAAALGEFGGLGLVVKGHSWSGEGWGYQPIPDSAALTARYEDLLRRAWALNKSPGLSAVIYTQITDVETESNGLMTYDRAVLKVDPKRVSLANRGLLPPPKPLRYVQPTAEVKPIFWRYSMQQPKESWTQATFEDSGWQTGEAGFGTDGTPGAIIGTRWDTSDIWLRRTFTVAAAQIKGLSLRLHHDEDVEIYLNGALAGQFPGYATAYETLPLTKAGSAALHPGENTIAVHCHQTGNGQFIDVGLVQQ